MVREREILGSDKRIAELAADVAEHWEQRREVLRGKGMIVASTRGKREVVFDELLRSAGDIGADLSL